MKQTEAEGILGRLHDIEEDIRSLREHVQLLTDADQADATFICSACAWPEKAGLRLTYEGAPPICENCASMWPECENCNPTLRDEAFHRKAVWRISGVHPEVRAGQLVAEQGDRPELWCELCKREGIDDPRSMADELGIIAESLL